MFLLWNVNTHVFPTTEQYDTFVKFTHDQLMRRFGEQPASCEYMSCSHVMQCVFQLCAVMTAIQGKKSDWEVTVEPIGFTLIFNENLILTS